MARRDLEELRAAINHHRREDLHDRIVSVVLPPRRPPRERWLTRSEAARLLREAWRRPKCKQLARFILFALYTGRRATVLCRASFRRSRDAPGSTSTKANCLRPNGQRKRRSRPPCPDCQSTLPHLRRWRDRGHDYVVESGDGPIVRIDRTMKEVAIAAGLGNDVTPHVLRHTAATWLMQAGTDMLIAAKFLGMTTRTLETTYAHFRPDYLAQAKAAFTVHRDIARANTGPTISANLPRTIRD